MKWRRQRPRSICTPASAQPAHANSPRGRSHAPRDEVDPGEDERLAVEPLQVGRHVDVAAGLGALLTNVGDPLRIEPDAQDPGAGKGVRLAKAEDDDRYAGGNRQPTHDRPYLADAELTPLAQQARKDSQRNDDCQRYGADLGRHRHPQRYAEPDVVLPPAPIHHAYGEVQAGENEGVGEGVDNEEVRLLDQHHRERRQKRRQQADAPPVEPGTDQIDEQDGHQVEGRRGRPADEVDLVVACLLQRLRHKANQEDGQGAVDEEAEAAIVRVEGEAAVSK